MRNYFKILKHHHSRNALHQGVCLPAISVPGPLFLFPLDCACGGVARGSGGRGGGGGGGGGRLSGRASLLEKAMLVLLAVEVAVRSGGGSKSWRCQQALEVVASSGGRSKL